MATSNKKIEEIKTGGDLELLAAPILRNLNSDYKSFRQTGINKKGQTIKDPVDGMVKIVKNGKVNFIFFEFTIDEKLERKWLNDISKYSGKPPKSFKNGDLIKVAQTADKYRKKFPDAIFRVCLCTNQKVSSTLDIKVEKKCKELNLLNDAIIDFSVLVSFLDNEPVGHWIRQEHLGISAELLSLELFNSICKKTMKNYHDEIHYDDEVLIEREKESEFKKLILEGEKPNIFLSGDSGVGKSILIYRSLNSLSKDVFALRIRKKYFEKSSSLNNAIYLQIKEFIPNLFQTYLLDIFKLLDGKKIFIVAEDINQAGEEGTLIMKKIINWNKLPESKTTKVSELNDDNYIKIICPVWGKYFLDFITSYPDLNDSDFHSFNLERFSIDEANKSLSLIFEKYNVQLASSKIEQISQALNFDPFLIGIYKKMVKSSKDDFLSLANKALEKYLSKELLKVERKSNLPMHVVTSSLNDFASLLLKNKNLIPNYNSIKDWFTNDNQSIVFNLICQEKNIFRLNKNGSLIFRHDRIRDAVLVNSLLRIIKNNTDAEIIEEPFFSDLIGQAISRLQLSDDKIKFLLEKNPLSLFVALQYFDGQKNRYFENYILILKSWLDKNLKSNMLHENMIWEISKTLYQVDLPDVLNLTENFPNDSLTYATNFRNGRFGAGVSFITYYNYKSDFEPTTIHKLRDELIEITKLKFYSPIEKSLSCNLKNAKLNEDEEHFRYSIIILAGYWKSKKLSATILESWNNALKKEECLQSAIWAIIQSESEDLEEHLLPLLKFWKEFPEPELNLKPQDEKILGGVYYKDETEINYRKETKENLSQCRWDLNENTIRSLIKLSKQDKEYEKLLIGILYKIDSPITFELMIKSVGKNYKAAKNSKNDIFFINYFSFIRKHDPSERNGRILSKETLIFLQKIWSNKNINEYKRIVAIDIWSKNISHKGLPILQKISFSDNKTIVNIAFNRRIQLGDKKVIKHLAQFHKFDKHGVQNLDKIWSEELLLVLEKIFKDLGMKNPIDLESQKLYPSYHLMKSVKKLKVKDAETFLERFWKYSGKTSSFFLTALLIGTPKLLKMAQQSILDDGNPKDFFKYLSSIYGFMITNEQNIITINSLENLLEYHEYLSMKQIEDIAKVCQSLGYIEWSRENVLPHLGIIERKTGFHKNRPIKEDLKKIFFPDIDELKEMFSKKAKSSYQISDHWFQRFEIYGYSRERFFIILKEWIIENPTFENYKLMAKCIEKKGDRSNLHMLDIKIKKFEEDKLLKVKHETIFVLKKRSLN